MGRPKKVVETPKPKKKPVIKYRVVIKEQHRDFNYQSDAREFARVVLQNNAVYFMECKKIKVEEDC